MRREGDLFGVRMDAGAACRGALVWLTRIPLAHEAEELLGPGSPCHPLQKVLQRKRQLLLWGDSMALSAVPAPPAPTQPSASALTFCSPSAQSAQ